MIESSCYSGVLGRLPIARLPSMRRVSGAEIPFVPNVAFRGPLALEVEWDA